MDVIQRDPSPREAVMEMARGMIEIERVYGPETIVSVSLILSRFGREVLVQAISKGIVEPGSCPGASDRPGVTLTALGRSSP